MKKEAAELAELRELRAKCSELEQVAARATQIDTSLRARLKAAENDVHYMAEEIAELRKKVRFPHEAAVGAKNAAESRVGGDSPDRVHDPVNHPSHYTSHPSGVECITVVEHLPFNVGSAIKYLWRAGLKTASPREDLRKAAWYVQRELERLAKN